MSKPADAEPPFLRSLQSAAELPPGTILPIPIESRVTTVARVFAIIRDIVIIVFLAAVFILGMGVFSRISTADIVDDGVSTEAPACPSPKVDQWGTFCPETPGG